MKKVLWLIVCLMTMVIGLTSCSKKDYKSLIVGTWEVTHVDGIVDDLSNDIPQMQDVHINKSFTDTETSNDWIDEEFHVRMQFSNINNSVSVFYYHNHKWDYQVKDYDRLLYYIQGNRLVMYDTEEWVGDEDYIENSDDDVLNYEIVLLTENYMKLHLSGENSKWAREHGKSHQYITCELKRIAQ